MATDTDHLSKIAYLAKRNPALTHEQFIRRWRQHGAFAMGLAQWKVIVRYTHCDTLAVDGSPAPYDGYDGIGMTWMSKSVDTWSEGADFERDQKALRQDELETFSANCDQFMVALRQRTIKHGWGPVKMTVFVTRGTQISESEFAEYWMNRHSAAVLEDPRTIDSVRRLAYNAAVSEQINSPLGFDGVAEYWFARVEDATRYFDDAPAAELDSRLVDANRTQRVLTNDIVIYDFAR